tara:strand:- start:9757 stop:10305 length:549 start_codon:yes stop_codon:yes gene_type:complete
MVEEYASGTLPQYLITRCNELGAPLNNRQRSALDEVVIKHFGKISKDLELVFPDNGSGTPLDQQLLLDICLEIPYKRGPNITEAVRSFVQGREYSTQPKNIEATEEKMLEVYNLCLKMLKNSSARDPFATSQNDRNLFLQKQINIKSNKQFHAIHEYLRRKGLIGDTKPPNPSYKYKYSVKD